MCSMAAGFNSRSSTVACIASATDAIADALERAGGSKTKAAQLLRIDRKTLYNHLKKAKLG